MARWLTSVMGGLTSKPDPPPVETRLATCAHCGRGDLRVPVTSPATVFCSGECRWYFTVDRSA